MSKRGICGLLAVVVLLITGSQVVLATPPYTLTELFTEPWPFGVSARQVSISDDGAFIACGWNADGQHDRDLYVYDVAADSWRRVTFFWDEQHQRLKAEHVRELDQARADWAEEHAATASAESAEAADEDAEEFDDSELVEQYEEDLKKAYDSFYGLGETLFLAGGHELLYTYDGELYSLAVNDPAAQPRRRLAAEQGFGSLARIPGRSEILLACDADVFLWQPADGALRQLTFGGWSDYDNTSVYDISGDLQWLATVRRDYTAVRKQQMPELLADDPYTTSHYHVRPQDTPESVRLQLRDLTQRKPWVIDVELPVEPFYEVEHLAWAPDGSPRLLVGTITGDGKTYEAYLVRPLAPGHPEHKEYETELVYREQDEYWINWARTGVRWDNRGGLLLHSERDGWAGLYRLEPPPLPDQSPSPVLELVSTATETSETEPTYTPRRLDTGGCEISAVYPLRHTPLVMVQLLDPDPASRAIGFFDLDVNQLTAKLYLGGMASWLALSEDEQQLVFANKTATQMDDLYLYNLDGPAPARLVQARNPAAWLEWTASWSQQFIQVPGPGGDIAVKLWLPPDWQPQRSYPLLIWLHGAGYAQTVNRDAGFYTLFHPWVAEDRGWIVAEVDYRGSEGYGRDWRTAVYGQLGHPEVADLQATKQFLVETYGADPERTALWGWSYGGFLTLMAMSLAPEDFPVGIAVAPVTRWENYFYWYSTCRLGHPDDNKEAYELSSAETYLADLTGNLLIVHGLRDDNTLFQSVAQYIEKGHELGVPIELKLFPSDNHGIGHDHHYLRIYEAILDHCESQWRAAGR
ncbi:S9 family peptidase [bacterium]|nr:S9 family peptidase [bacterium]